MALTYTPEVIPQQTFPQFNAKTIFDEVYSSTDFLKCKVGLVFFICNHCPYVKAIEDRIIGLGHFLKDYSVSLLAICSNDPNEYPEDSKINLQNQWTTKKYPFPYIFDEDQSIAHLFKAVCTPDFFVYNFQNKREGELAYRGRLDDSWKSPEKVQKEELKEAILELLQFNKISQPQSPSMGCSIKWKINE